MVHRSWPQLGPMAPLGIVLAAFRFKGPHGIVTPVLLAVAVLIIALIIYAIRRRRKRRLASQPGIREQAWAAGEAWSAGEGVDRSWQ